MPIGAWNRVGAVLCAQGALQGVDKCPLRQRRGRVPHAATCITARNESGIPMMAALGLGLSVTVHGQGIVGASRSRTGRAAVIEGHESSAA